MHQLARSPAAEWAPGMRVDVLAPGHVRMGSAPVDDPRFRRHRIERRAAPPEEPGRAVVFLASPASASTTGAVLRIDGGYSVF